MTNTFVLPSWPGSLCACERESVGVAQEARDHSYVLNPRKCIPIWKWPGDEAKCSSMLTWPWNPQEFNACEVRKSNRVTCFAIEITSMFMIGAEISVPKKLYAWGQA